jgi:hypothetical protein
MYFKALFGLKYINKINSKKLVRSLQQRYICIVSTLQQRYSNVTAINMATRRITMLYGEGTVQVNFRIPQSKRTEIEKRFKDILKEYVDLKVVEVEVDKNPSSFSKNHKEVIKSISSKFTVENTEPIKAIIPEKEIAISKSEKVKELQALADSIKSNNPISESMVKTKISIDEEYDFEVVNILPDLDCQIPIDKKQISFYDKYDLGIFYVRWEGRFLKFIDKKEFDRFCKNNEIK